MASEKAGRPQFIEHKITHYRQRFNWDCGVSCVLMLLEEEQRRELLNKFAETCQEEGFNQSTWTIDLCYLLKRYGIRHQMCTIMPGVNEDYKKHGYYDRILDLDRERVRRRFDEATSTGIEVSQRSLSTDELVAHLVSSGPVVLLVDAGLLVCDLCKHNKLKAEFRRCFGGGYRGHYVVAVGLGRGRVLYRDPALSPRLCAATPQALARARTAPGTDQDAVLVYKDFS
ncbi:protein GUCD1 [Ostrinia furnacalis]|uniref:protein GUCD1 n=1 Tax=Ostrinia furnacalis TaxID=93504 RepID=UPI00103FCC51|nr:protein GUCD1 [Ostrinia furnacalis]